MDNSNNKDLEIIGAYIVGDLTNEQKIEFESRIQSDRELKELYKEQLILTEGIKRAGLKEQINTAQANYLRRKRNIIRGGIASLLFVVGITSYLYYENTHQKAVFKPTAPLQEKTVIVKEVSEAIIEDTTENILISSSEPLKTERIIAPEKMPFSEVEETNEIEKLLSAFTPKKQIFQFTTTRLHTITGKKGTKLQIPPWAFVDSKGNKVIGVIKLELTEYYTMQNFINAGLETSSDGGILESGGMLYIKALYQNQEVHLAENKTIEVSFANDFEKSGMSLFLGDSIKGKVNWKQVIETNTSKPVECLSVEEMIAQSHIDAIKQAENKKIKEDLGGKIKGKTKEEIDLMVKEANENIQAVYQLPQLGWINCDKFYNSKAEKILFTIETPNAKSFQKTVLIFENINSMMVAFEQNGKHQFADLPLNEPITILSTGYENGKFYLSKIKTKISKETVKMTLEEVEKDEIQKTIAQFN